MGHHHKAGRPGTSWGGQYAAGLNCSHLCLAKKYGGVKEEGFVLSFF